MGTYIESSDSNEIGQTVKYMDYCRRAEFRLGKSKKDHHRRFRMSKISAEMAPKC